MLFYLAKLSLNLILYYFESMSKVIVKKNQSNKTKLFYSRCMFGWKWHLCNVPFYSKYAWVYTERNIIWFFLPDVTILTVILFRNNKDWIANTSKIAGNVGDKFQLENFRPTVANKSELEVCLYSTCLVLFSFGIFTCQVKNMEK